MRKTVEILLVVLTVLLFATAFLSCSAARQKAGQRAAALFTGAFSCAADVTVSGHVYTVNLVRLADGDSTVQFVKPAELAQLSFNTDSSGLHVRYGTLQVKLDSASVPQSAIPTALLSAFSSTAKGSSATLQGKNTVLKGQTAAGPFTLTLDEKGLPASLSLPRQNLTARIYHFSAS